MNRLALLLVALPVACGSDSLCDGCMGLGPALRVAPTTVIDSTTGVHTDTIQVTNDGGGELHWSAQRTQPASWLALVADSGMAGINPLLLHLDPTGLALGIYRDTVVVVGRESSGAFSVAIELLVH